MDAINMDSLTMAGLEVNVRQNKLHKEPFIQPIQHWKVPPQGLNVK